MLAARQAYWSTHSGRILVIRWWAPRASYLKRNASEPFGLGRASLQRLLNLVHPDQTAGQLTWGGPLVVACDARAVVVAHVLQQRLSGDCPGVDALHQDRRQVVTLGTVGARLLVELSGVLLGELAGGRAARARQDGVFGRGARLLDVLRILRTIVCHECAFEAAVA